MKMSADVAKLADALDLGSSARKGVPVQVRPSAPMIYEGCSSRPSYSFVLAVANSNNHALRSGSTSAGPRTGKDTIWM